MAFRVNGRILGDTAEEAAANMTEDEIREMLLDWIVLWDKHPSEMIATGEIFKYTRRQLVLDALKDMESYFTSYGKVEYFYRIRKPVDCGCGKTRCTRCGKCGSKNLALKGTSNRAPAKKASSRKTTAGKPKAGASGRYRSWPTCSGPLGAQPWPGGRSWSKPSAPATPSATTSSV